MIYKARKQVSKEYIHDVYNQNMIDLEENIKEHLINIIGNQLSENFKDIGELKVENTFNTLDYEYSLDLYSREEIKNFIQALSYRFGINQSIMIDMLKMNSKKEYL